MTEVVEREARRQETRCRLTELRLAHLQAQRAADEKHERTTIESVAAHSRNLESGLKAALKGRREERLLPISSTAKTLRTYLDGLSTDSIVRERRGHKVLIGLRMEVADKATRLVADALKEDYKSDLQMMNKRIQEATDEMQVGLAAATGTTQRLIPETSTGDVHGARRRSAFISTFSAPEKSNGLIGWT